MNDYLYGQVRSGAHVPRLLAVHVTASEAQTMKRGSISEHVASAPITHPTGTFNPKLTVHVRVPCAVCLSIVNVAAILNRLSYSTFSYNFPLLSP